MHHSFNWPDFLPAFGHAAEDNGFFKQILAETENGPLVVWEKPSHGPKVYLSSGIHGDEPAGPLALLDLMSEGFFTPDFHWVICPALNPGGLAACSRENSSGIDLNRDYLQRLTPEVQAHAAWVDAHPVPALFLSLHEDWEATDFYLYEINLGEDQPRRALDIIKAVKPWFSAELGSEIDGHIPRGPGWIFHAAEADMPEGWPEAIFLAKLGCPLSFTFETPSHKNLSDRVSAHCAAVRQACKPACRAAGDSSLLQFC